MSHFEQDLADVERALLRSARLDDRAVSSETHQRILAGLGITGVLSSVSSVASGTVVASAAASSVARATLVVALKWAAIGATAGSFALGTAPHLERALSSKATPPAVTAAPHQEPPPSPSTAAPLAQLPENPPIAIRPLPTIAATPREPSAPSPVAQARPSELAAEVQSLDRVRSALVSGDPNGALTLLAAHQLEFPHGHLSPEATYLRVQALVKSGNRPAAIDLARRFVASFPESPQAASLRSLALESHPSARP
jgi:hypothetical protein